MSQSKKKILLIIPNLMAGGAEKVIAFLAKSLNRDIFDVTLVIIDSKRKTLFDVNGVDTIYLNKQHVKSAFFSIIRTIKKERPDLVLSTLSHLNTLMGLISYLFPKIVFVGRETIVSKTQDEFSKKNLMFVLFRIISKISYAGLNIIISQSNDMKEDLISYQGFRKEKIRTINNPISEKFMPKKDIWDFRDKLHLITVGRLTKKKGHERILRCLTKIQVPFNYKIIGDGPEKNIIKNLAEELNISDYIENIEFTDEVYKHLKESHIYLQGSYVEGFPNALLESLAVGTPAVVFEAPGGINEIIIENENGFIAASEDEFITKLIELIKNLQFFHPAKVTNHVISKYSAKVIVKQYEDLFLELID